MVRSLGRRRDIELFVIWPGLMVQLENQCPSILPNPDVSIALGFEAPGNDSRRACRRSVDNFHRLIADGACLTCSYFGIFRGRVRQREIGAKIFREIRCDVSAIFIVEFPSKYPKLVRM